MSKKKIFMIIWPIVLVVVALAIIIPSILIKSPIDAYRSIKIEILDGNATVERNNDKLDAFKGMNLRNNDCLLTSEGSYAVLKLDTDKYVYVGENSDIDLISSENDSSLTKIRINEGSIVTEVKNKLSSTEVFDIESPNSTMAIRGTTFKTTVKKSTIGYEIKYSLVEGKINLSVIEKTEEDINVANLSMNAGEEVTILAKGSAVLTRDNLTNVINKIVNDDPSVNKTDYNNVKEFVSKTDKIDLTGKDLSVREIGEILANVINNHEVNVNRVVSANATFAVYLDDNLLFSEKYVYENSKEFKIIATAQKYEGYKVKYWLVNNKEVSGEDSIELIINETSFIQPVYEETINDEPIKETFKINIFGNIYDENVLLNDSPFNSSRIIESNKEITLELSMPEGYTFLGYFEEGSDVALTTDYIYKFEPTKDINIIIKFNKN